MERERERRAKGGTRLKINDRTCVAPTIYRTKRVSIVRKRRPEENVAHLAGMNVTEAAANPMRNAMSPRPPSIRLAAHPTHQCWEIPATTQGIPCSHETMTKESAELLERLQRGKVDSRRPNWPWQRIRWGASSSYPSP